MHIMRKSNIYHHSIDRRSNFNRKYLIYNPFISFSYKSIVNHGQWISEFKKTALFLQFRTFFISNVVQDEILL